MYGLPVGEDLTFLLGKELIQVCAGLHQTILYLNGDTSISLECKFEVSKLLDGESEGRSCCSTTETLLTPLGSRIVSVANKGDGELAVAFSDGSTLVIFDSNPDHESYQISDSTHSIIV
jgi:hypothetical protein